MRCAEATFRLGHSPPGCCDAADPSKLTNLPGALERHIVRGAMADSLYGIALQLDRRRRYQSVAVNRDVPPTFSSREL